MHCVINWDNTERVIKRLSKYEKRILHHLSDRGSDIKTMRTVIGMPHRSSMSRVVTTLEGKGLIVARPGESGGGYRKRISLTPAGKEIADWILNTVPAGELIQ